MCARRAGICNTADRGAARSDEKDDLRKTGEPEVQLELKQNPALLGGFVLHIGDDEYDQSMRASIRNMRKSLIRR